MLGGSSPGEPRADDNAIWAVGPGSLYDAEDHSDLKYLGSLMKGLSGVKDECRLLEKEYPIRL